jgi:hypothetical protein
MAAHAARWRRINNRNSGTAASEFLAQELHQFVRRRLSAHA